MRFPLILCVFSSLCFAITKTLSVPLAKPGCQEKCGNITIPYPFGISSNCSANSSYTVTCLNSSIPFLNSIKMEALNISLYGTVIVKQPVSPVNCSSEQRTGSLPISLQESPFTISGYYNSLVVLGCKNSVWLAANKTTVRGCMALCDANSTDASCNGVNCCQVTIPTRVQELQYTYKSTEAINNNFCGYIFPVDKKWLQKEEYKSYTRLLSDPSNPLELGFAPLVLDWELRLRQKFSATSCVYFDKYQLTSINRHAYGYDCYSYISNILEYVHPNIYHHNPRCPSLLDSSQQEHRYSSYYRAHDYVSSTQYCSCSLGFEGNPYLPGGCCDINECSNPTLNSCPIRALCINTPGGYDCDYGYHGDHGDGSDKILHIIKLSSIIVGSILGAVLLVIATWKSGKAITNMIKASRRYMFFKRNGGLLLEQHLSATENGLEKTKLFTSNELAKATDSYNENRILGRGGQGTVYKGMLEDGRIVAVKKSKKVDADDLEIFINEVVILSQVNHRNVVKLLGCCLETEVPRLVYEFISNGTLFQHIHEPNEDFPLNWEMRVRIAREIAGALSYLHSAASAPIYHRDIKSTNILLDDKHRAKIADFGTSRSVSIDQTHVTTRIVGTFGYLDPEYFRSSQFTEKSDVYSFGVVMVELLTGEKAISSIRVETGRGLATHFLHSMEENQLFEILDVRVLDGPREEIVAMAELAKRCLHLNGKRRPTMRAVARDLEAIQMQKEGLDLVQNHDDTMDLDVADSDYDDFSISGSMHFDTTISHAPDGESRLLPQP